MFVRFRWDKLHSTMVLRMVKINPAKFYSKQAPHLTSRIRWVYPLTFSEVPQTKLKYPVQNNRQQFCLVQKKHPEAQLSNSYRRCYRGGKDIPQYLSPSICLSSLFGVKLLILNWLHLKPFTSLGMRQQTRETTLYVFTTCNLASDQVTICSFCANRRPLCRSVNKFLHRLSSSLLQLLIEF